MADIVDSQTRSRMMSGIRGKNTKIELLVRKLLFSKGFRFRINHKGLPGKPDLVFPRYNAVIFVHGCYWHGHKCSLFRLPKTNRKFWREKIGGNQKRDILNFNELKKQKWRVLTVWECALRGKTDKELLIIREKLSKWIASKSKMKVIYG
jgi:DNA mismatch endonuclease (patch repair protein)